jgi:hypothetical protein
MIFDGDKALADGAHQAHPPRPIGEGTPGRVRDADLLVVQRWSERIAERVAPEEADFAAEVGVAYAAGGQARKDLLPRPGVQPGAFGPGSCAADLPLILRGLADSASMLLALLRSPYLSNALASGSLLVTFRADHRHEQAAEAGRAASRRATEPEPQPPPVSERQALESAFESLRDRLASAGFGQARAGQVACELLEELLTDTMEAALFVDALAAVPDSGVRTRRSAARHRKGS